MYFFGFLPQTNENMKKTLKKSLLRQNFLLYSNCIYYTTKNTEYCHNILFYETNHKSRGFQRF